MKLTRTLRQSGLVAATWLCLAATPVLAQETITLSPTKDNSIFSEDDSLSNGAGIFLFAGTSYTTNNGGIRRALVAFEDLSAIGAGATVTSVELAINVSKVRPEAGPGELRLHRLLADWGQGASDATGNEGRGATAMEPDATWTSRMLNGDAWNNAGGDFDATVSSAVTVDQPGSYVFPNTPELIADLEFWLANPDQNFGWIVVMDDTLGNAKRFDSRENGSSDSQPQLNVAFAPAVDPEFPINFGHSGGWFNFDTAGQGVMIEVFPATQQVFLTWFTYETAESAKIGSSDHRWLSGLGTYDGDSVEIDLQVTSGAFFDDPTDPARTAAGTVGTVVLEFSSCSDGTMSYNLLEPQQANSFTIQRLAAPPQTCLDLAGQVAR